MSHTLTLPAELTIYTVAQLRPQWLECAGTPGHWQADGAAVDEIDAAGVQMLVSLGHAVTHGQGSLSLVNASQTLATACEGLGLASLLCSPGAAGGAA